MSQGLEAVSASSGRKDGRLMARSPQAQIDEKDVVARINRYSLLRSVGRAVRPSVRRRISLAGAGRRQDLLGRLQRVHDGVRHASAMGRAPGPEVEGIGDVDAELDDLADRLVTTIRATPIASFRAMLPDVVGTHRTDAVALLDFWLDTMDWRTEPFYLVEYLITLLSTEVIDGRATLVRDPSCVSPGVDRACARHAAAAEGACLQAREAAEQLREASMGLLSEVDLEGTIVAMRSVKAGARDGFFDRDLLRSTVQYNTTVKNRFAALEGAAFERAGCLERTLAALRALDLPEPMAAVAAP